MPYTTIVDFSRAWLSDPADPTDNPLVCGTQRTTGDATDAIDGEVRYFAGDQSQLVSRTTETRTVPVTLRVLTPAQFAQIKSWKGKVLLLRTAQGEKMFGGYLALTYKPYLRTSVGDDGRAFDVALTFTEISYSEAV